jgi:hypothetical protein
MNSADNYSAKHLNDHAAKLLSAARAFHAAAEQPGSCPGTPNSLASLEKALQMLSAACYQLVADASPGIAQRWERRSTGDPSWPRVDGLSREQEVRLMGTLHDVAAAFARCARECRDARSTVTPLIARRVSAERSNQQRRHDELPAVQRHEGTTQHVA